ncbi:helix-turn-helix domain-containing protein [Oceanirhabdus sp. W0125-5]|uniref:helix-turn-helix domain-containing protein n=1 Tax=Oceanirhabdus sp. W0125-5 TaxID=2999116 RepID=UPI0022F326F8|nr:helix-turn-helix domain-containing protein [Oceanirhabdus sp. W0125-5]WBW96469.1 helix-turn-helix domain-containing protein [Oceanirhabdus sp. W0125-5]
MPKIQFFNEINPLLKLFIRHYWYVNEEANPLSSYELLPMDHVDLIITNGKPFVYGDNKSVIKSDSIHFHGIRENSVLMTQSGKIQALGVSFTPWGFYFLVREPMSNFVNKIVDLNDVNNSLCKEIYKYLNLFDKPYDFVQSIESELIGCIRVTEQEEKDCSIISDFIVEDVFNIKEYCEANRISVRRLERIFRKYIGISPKMFMNILRFEEASRDIMYKREFNLTDISYKHGYYDQPHFVKSFKGFAKHTPSKFQVKAPALKSHFKYK